MDQAYVRYYYEEDEKRRGKLLIECIKIPMIINFILSIFIVIFYKKIANYIVQDSSLLVAIFIIIYLFASIIFRFVTLDIRMKQKAKLYSTLNVILKLSYILFVGVLSVFLKDSYQTLTIATVISIIVSGAVAIFFERDIVKIQNKNLELKTETKEMIKFGFPIIFSTIILWLFQSIDRISIRKYCGYTELGLYSGAMSIIALLNALQGAFTTFWTPVAYEKYCKDSNDKSFFKDVNNVISVIMLILAVALILFKDIIVILLGEKYRQAMFIFPCMVFMPVMSTISETTVIGINFKKKTRIHIYISVISALVNLFGNTILVPIYGAKGAAISTGISYMVFYLLRTYFSNKYYKVDYNMRRFLVASTLVYIIAIYSSFNSTDMLFIFMGIFSVFIICILNKEIIIKYVKIIKNKGLRI